MISNDEFLARYRVEAEFEQANTEWTELVAIYQDHKARMEQLRITGSTIAERLRLIEGVHSLKFRVKDPEHLIEKVIRKNATGRGITLENYREEVTDLVGVRALHLFKDDWLRIHCAIMKDCELHEEPVANVRNGDGQEIYTKNGCKINLHKDGYRSVHYVIKSKPMKETYLAEVQVRTIFEEGWCEIDHRLRYPYDLNNTILSQYLALFNRLAGSADEMGTFISWLMKELRAREEETTQKIKEVESERDGMIDALNEVKQKLDQKGKEKGTFLILDAVCAS